MQPYAPTPINIFRMVLEVLLVVAVFWNIFEEIREMLRTKIETGSLTNYVKQFWNWVDILSLSIQLVGFSLWWVLRCYADTPPWFGTGPASPVPPSRDTLSRSWENTAVLFACENSTVLHSACCAAGST